MKLSIASCSLQDTTEEIAAAIESAKDGLLVVKDLPMAPISTMQKLFDHLAGSKDLGERLNKAYMNNLVYKDSYAAGKGGPMVDRKRVLDLSPERLDSIRKADPSLLVQSAELDTALAFWNNTTAASDKITKAIAKAIGSEAVLNDVFFNYRMADYYAHDDDGTFEAPRCGEHRDFGTYTLIFSQEPGLQVQKDGVWVDVPVMEDTGSAILMFGWCAQIRSNGRIPAALHRVVQDDPIQRRTTAVFFCAPKHSDTILEPVVRAGEVRKYISGVQVGQLRGNMARKWQKREGTISNANLILEEEEIRATKRMTQDDVVRDTIAIQTA